MNFLKKGKVKKIREIKNRTFEQRFQAMILTFLIQMLILFALLAGVILLVHYFIVTPFLKNRQTIVRLQQSATEEQKILIPLRLQACERFILYLERINPSNLLLRLNQPGQNPSELQAALIRTVREEFDYNLSQQLYIKQSTWELIRNAKEETISLINRAAAKVPVNGTSADLSKALLDLSMERSKPVSAKAIESVKSEMC